MNLRRFPLLFLTTFAFIVGGCEKASQTGPDEKVLFKTIEENASSVEKRDVDGVMATIHPKSPTFATTRTTVSESFQMMKAQNLIFRVTSSDLKVISSSPEEAKVSFVQKTGQVDGDHTTPLNVVEGIHTLRSDDGNWKIFNTQNTKVTRLGSPTASAPEPAAAQAPAAPATPESAAKPAAPEEKPAEKSTEKPAPTETTPPPPPPAEKPAQ